MGTAIALREDFGAEELRRLAGKVPANITLVFLPPASPELNPAENIWQYLRQTWLSNRVFESYEAICEACCQVWRKLTAEAGRIQTIATRSWAP